MVYIEGYSLFSPLGENANSSVKSLREYKYEPTLLDGGIKYYKIPNIKPMDYYDIIEKSIQDAIINANLSADEIKNSALFIGTSSAKLPLNEKYIKEEHELVKDLYMDEITKIIANRVGIKGLKTVISTACTSSANALVQAKEMIESGIIDRVIVVGVELYNELSIKGFDSFMLLSHNKMRPFDNNRDGIILGEAVSTIILSRQKSDFEIIGGAVKVDTSSITAPTPQNLASVMQEALQNANITTKDITIVKTHSTATRQNDEAEAKALHILFKSDIPKVVALKPYIGHTMGACGTNELALLIEAIKQGFIPKSLNSKDIDSQCNITPTTKEFSVKEGYCLLNYFGFGGNNNSLVLKYGV